MSSPKREVHVLQPIWDALKQNVDRNFWLFYQEFRTYKYGVLLCIFSHNASNRERTKKGRLEEMREVVILEPGWYGTEPYIGIAHFRLAERKFVPFYNKYVDKPFKGNILIWVDYMIKDKNDPEGHMILMWPYPFVISCEEAIKYPPNYLNDRRHTMVHIIPVSNLTVKITRRKRTEPQSTFKEKINEAKAIETQGKTDAK
jgi:hypothetical protein